MSEWTREKIENSLAISVCKSWKFCKNCYIAAYCVFFLLPPFVRLWCYMNIVLSSIFVVGFFQYSQFLLDRVTIRLQERASLKGGSWNVFFKVIVVITTVLMTIIIIYQKDFYKIITFWHYDKSFFETLLTFTCFAFWKKFDFQACRDRFFFFSTQTLHATTKLYFCCCCYCCFWKRFKIGERTNE